MKMFPIKYRLIISLSIILIFAFLAMNIVNYRVSKSSVRDGIINSSLPLTRDNIYSEIQADLMRPIFVSSLMANDTFLKDWSLEGEKNVNLIRKYLLEIKERYGFFSAFYVSQATKNYYHFKGLHKQISRNDPHDIWYFDFIDLNRDFDLDVDTDEASGNNLTIFINHRVKDYQGNLMGVTGVGLKMDQIAKILGSYKSKYNRNIFLVDPEGLVQVHTNEDFIEKVTLQTLTGVAPLVDKILIKTAEPTVFEFDRDNQHILLTARYIPEFDWYLIVEQNQNEALASLRDNFIRNMAFAFIIICIVLGISIFTVNFYQTQLERLTVTDKLTGAFNRRELDISFEKTLRSAQRQQTPFSVILIDIDHFKKINDGYGHLVGDRVIKQTVDVINGCIRGNDLLVRWGGDEFMTLTPSSLETACAVAERIRCSIEAHQFLSDTQEILQVTISGGVAECKPSDDVDSLTKRADAALYAAKGQGRNKIICDTELKLRNETKEFNL